MPGIPKPDRNGKPAEVALREARLAMNGGAGGDKELKNGFFLKNVS
jgi:hypothetical protein